MKHQLLTLSLILITSILTLGCGDNHQLLIQQAYDQITQEPNSPYTGRLIPIGNGTGAQDAVALEWGNGQLYMLANHGTYPNKAQYLFTVDRDTGKAKRVNPGAMDLGGSFRQGRNFTQVKNVSPKDMAWLPPPSDPTQAPPGYIGEMLAICPVIDSIVGISVEGGFASRINWEKGYCVLNQTQDTILEPYIDSAIAITHHNSNFIIAGRYQGSQSTQIFQVSGNFRCATPLVQNAPINFNSNESHPYTLCSDGQYLYMSGADTQSLYILNPFTGEAILISAWEFVTIPEGYEVHDFRPDGQDIFDKDANTYGGLWITGLTFDRQNMFAICAYTDTLYKLETQ